MYRNNLQSIGLDKHISMLTSKPLELKFMA